MSNITQHPHTFYVQQINSVKKSKSFDAFIGLLEYALKRRLDTSPLNDLWDEIAPLIEPPQRGDLGYLEVFCSFLVKLQFSNHSEINDDTKEPVPTDKIKKTESESLNKLADTKDIKDAKEAADNALIARINNEIEIRKTANPTYSFFLPAWDMDKLLTDVWGEDNPGRIIGQYLSAMYPNDYSSFPFCDKKEFFTIRVDEDVIFLLYKIGSFLEESLIIGEELDLFTLLILLMCEGEYPVTRILVFLSEAGKNNHKLKESAKKHIMEEHSDSTLIMHQMLTSPQPVFNLYLVCWLKRWHGTAPPTIEQLLTLFCLSIGRPYKQGETISSVPVEHSSYFENYLRLPYIPWSLLTILLESLDELVWNEEFLSDISIKAYVKLITSYKDHRLSNGGISPLTAEDSGFVYYQWSLFFRDDIGNDELDIALLMSDIKYLEEDSDFATGGVILDRESFELQNDTYLLACELSRKEGLDELADALIAFYLVFQPLYGKDAVYFRRINIQEHIKACLSSNRKRLCVPALIVASDLARKNGQKLDALWLDSFLTENERSTESRPGKLVSLKLNNNATRSQLEHELTDLLPLEKVTPSTKDMIINAEQYWEASHREIGRGQLDWGVPAGAFIKPIENELHYILKRVINGKAFERYKGSTPKRVTLGPMLHLLKKFDELPDDLKTDIEATGIDLHRKKKLLKELINLAHIRNRGFHAEEFTDKEYVKLREKLFIKGILKDFIESLHPDKCLETGQR